MPIYRKKPVMIEAIQLIPENLDQIVDFVPADILTLFESGSDEFGNIGPVATIKTPEGYMQASTNDFIIKGVKGEFYPCKPDIFEATYDLVTEFVQPPYDPDACGCRKCLNTRKEPIMFVVCNICGNKRCPHATDHELECTNSNEPGQKGSVYE